MAKKNLAVMVYDHCEFSFIATYLSQYFENVFLTTDWISGFPYYGAKNIGSGIEGITRVDEPESMEDEIDIHFFTDLYFKDRSERLRKEGRYVWGSGEFEMVERNRHLFYDLCVEASLPVPKTVFIKSYDKLMDYLKDKKDLWVKLTEYRGAGETFHWEDNDFNEFFNLELKRQIGARGLTDPDLEFLIQEPVDAEFEWGIDTYLVDSKFPENVYIGFENKCESYFGKLEEVKNLPDSWQEVIRKFEKVIAKYHFTGTFSMEVRRTKEGKEYFIDSCNRCPYPASAATMKGISNYGDIIVNALYNNETTKVRGDEYVAEIVVRTSILNNWIPIYFDKKYADKIFLCDNLIDKQGVSWRVPPEQLYSDSLKYMSAVSSGKDLDKVIEETEEVMGNVKSKGLEWNSTMRADSKKLREQLQEIYKYKF